MSNVREAQKTEIYTIVTDGTGITRLVHTANTWVKIRLRLENAGSVVVGTRQEIAPVASGRGILLTVNEDEVFELNKGERLYIASETVNRVKTFISPIPYLLRMTAVMEASLQAISNLKLPTTITERVIQRDVAKQKAAEKAFIPVRRFGRRK